MEQRWWLNQSRASGDAGRGWCLMTVWKTCLHFHMQGNSWPRDKTLGFNIPAVALYHPLFTYSQLLLHHVSLSIQGTRRQLSSPINTEWQKCRKHHLPSSWRFTVPFGLLRHSHTLQNVWQDRAPFVLLVHQCNSQQIRRTLESTRFNKSPRAQRASSRMLGKGECLPALCTLTILTNETSLYKLAVALNTI